MNNLKIVSIKIIIAALWCATTMNTYTSARFHGAQQLRDQNYTDLEMSGNGSLTRVKVTNNAQLGGSFHLTDFTCQHLTVRGSLMGEAIAAKNATISGSFSCKNSQFDVLDIDGSCKAVATKISTKLSVHGSIIASKVECPLIETWSTKVMFENSSVNTLIVWNPSTYKGILNLWGLFSWATVSQASEVYLDASHVGSITFQGLPGRVILTNQATIGTIINGTSVN